MYKQKVSSHLTFMEKTFLTSSQKENMKMASKESFLKNHCVVTSIEGYVFYENGSLYRKAQTTLTHQI